jgi:papain like protease
VATPTLDFRASQTTVRDQGERPTCAVFAVTAAHEWMAGDFPDLSEEYALWAAKARDGIPGEATQTQAVLAGIAAEEHAHAAVWPYGAPAWPAAPPQAALEPKNRRTAGKWRRHPQVELDVIAGSLAAGSAVILTLGFVPDAWYQPGANAVVDAPPGARQVGGHAVLAVGCQPASATMPDVVLVKNSWGALWGIGGYAFVTARYLNGHGIVAHVMEVA